MVFLRQVLVCLHKTPNPIVFIKRKYSKLEDHAQVGSAFISRLKELVGEQRISTVEAILEQHSHDESHHTPAPPDVVVFAENVEHVSEVVKLCNERKIPVLTFGSGTGLEGGVNAVKGGVCINLSKMDQIVNVNAADFDCTIQPGVTRSALNSYLRDTGLYFPIDPGADCSVCGMCATSASGTNAVRYGTMRENVLNLQVVLADGRVIDTAGKGMRAKKTSAGYNITNLFVGSEGTLGVITQATIKLYGIPEKTIAAICPFKSVREAVEAVVQIMQSGVAMAKLEFLDKAAIDIFNHYSHFSLPVADSLFLECHGPEGGLDQQFETVKQIIAGSNGYVLETASDEEKRKTLWKARHELLWATLAVVPGSKAYVTDVCVPISKLPEIIVKTTEMITQANVLGPIVGHVGDGNFHVFFPVKPGDDEMLATASRISKHIALLSLNMGGTCTGEHGIGLGKQDLLVMEVGNRALSAMKSVKLALDPNNIMNPGKIFLD